MDNGHLEQEIIDTKPLVLYNFDAVIPFLLINWCEAS